MRLWYRLVVRVVASELNYKAIGNDKLRSRLSERYI
jgi:hypothetical protein